MASLDTNDSHPDSSRSTQSSLTIQSTSLSSGTIHMYPFPSPSTSSQPQRSKRRQVKNACTNCQKACKKCDDARPCLRCVRYGVQEACVSSQRKERKKGVKRGPYKKRDGKDRAASMNTNHPEAPLQQGVHTAPPIPPPLASSPVVSSYMSFGLPTGYYSHFPPPPLAKSVEAPSIYPPYIFTHLPPTVQSPQIRQEAVINPTCIPHQCYSAAFVAQFNSPVYSPYSIARPDNQATLPNYTVYGSHLSARQSGTSSSDCGCDLHRSG